MTATLVLGQTSGRVLIADLERHYFTSPKAEIAARAELQSALQRLQVFRGKGATGVRLLHELQAYEQVLKIYRRHNNYLSLCD